MLILTKARHNIHDSFFREQVVKRLLLSNINSTLPEVSLCFLNINNSSIQLLSVVYKDLPSSHHSTIISSSTYGIFEFLFCALPSFVQSYSSESYLDLHFGDYAGRRLTYCFICTAIVRWFLFFKSIKRICFLSHYKPFIFSGSFLVTLYRLIGLFIPNPPISHLYNFTHKNITPKALLFTYSELVVSTSCLHSQVFSIAPYQSDLAVPKIIYIDNGLHFCHPDSLESTVLSPPQSQSAAQEYASRIERSLYLISESTSFKPFICLHPKASDASEFFTIPVSEISDTLTAASNARLVVSSYSRRYLFYMTTVTPSFYCATNTLNQFTPYLILVVLRFRTNFSTQIHLHYPLTWFAFFFPRLLIITFARITARLFLYDYPSTLTISSVSPQSRD